MHQSQYKLETMYEEHVATLDHLAVLAQAIRAPRTLRAAALPRYQALLGTLLAVLEDDVEDHFRFEELHLFPLLRDAGKPELADKLTLEHVAIRNATVLVLGCLSNALTADPSAVEWAEFGRLTTLLIETNRTHMAREEAEMVPLLRTPPPEGRIAPIR